MVTPKPDLSKAAERAAEAARNERIAKAWDGAMSRAFKGIMPAPERRAQLLRAVERNDV